MIEADKEGIDDIGCYERGEEEMMKGIVLKLINHGRNKKGMRWL